MSGPKKSHWEIRQEIIAKRRAEKIAKRQRQIKEIKDELKNCQNILNDLEKEFGALPQYLKNNINKWTREVELNLNGDLRDSFRALRGIKKYLNNQKSILSKRAKERLEEELKEQKLQEEKRLKEAKINSIIESLEEIKSDYSEIMNEGIEQRVELFKNSIKLNPDNPNTIKQIEQFKNRLYKLYEEHLEQKENVQYVADTFANILNGDLKEDKEGLSISGSIDGVPISVKLHQNSNSIDFDTPLDGSCKRAMEEIQKELNRANINLGEIKVLKTGQILNKKTAAKTQNRIKS